MTKPNIPPPGDPANPDPNAPESFTDEEGSVYVRADRVATWPMPTNEEMLREYAEYLARKERN